MAAGCGLFSTREPELPTSGGQTFTPPTSPYIVVENLKTAVKEKNAESFIQCLADTSRGDRFAYRFEPAAEIAARYASLFLTWNMVSERQTFISLMSKIPADTPPSLIISNDRFDVITQDSAIYTGDYVLTVNHSISAAKTRGVGIIRLTIAPNNLGQWSIIRWNDGAPIIANPSYATWSELKAQFSN